MSVNIPLYRTSPNYHVRIVKSDSKWSKLIYCAGPRELSCTSWESNQHIMEADDIRDRFNSHAQDFEFAIKDYHCRYVICHISPQ